MSDGIFLKNLTNMCMSVPDYQHSLLLQLHERPLPLQVVGVRGPNFELEVKIHQTEKLPFLSNTARYNEHLVFPETTFKNRN